MQFRSNPFSAWGASSDVPPHSTSAFHPSQFKARVPPRKACTSGLLLLLACCCTHLGSAPTLREIDPPATPKPPPQTQTASPDALWLDIRLQGPAAVLTLHNTGPNTNYFFFTREEPHAGLWMLEAEALGSDETNVVSVSIPMRGRTQLFAVGGVGIDSDGDGLPDIYEALVTHTDPFNPDTRGTGEPDGFGDSDGDGWTDAEEFRRRQDPFAADAGPPVAGLFRTVEADRHNTLGWASPAAHAESFTVERKVGNIWQDAGTVPGDATSFTDIQLTPGTPAGYRVRANYPAQSSAPTAMEERTPGSGDPSYTLPATIVRGAGGQMFFVAGTSKDVVTHRITRRVAPSIHPKNYIFEVGTNYLKRTFQPVRDTVTIEVPNLSAAAGPVPVTEQFMPLYGWYFLTFQQVGWDGLVGNATPGGTYFDATPYLDGREHLLENLNFALRAGGAEQPFNFQFGTGAFSAGSAYGFFPDYAVAGFHWMKHIYTATFEVFDPFRPFEDNAIFRNFCYDPQRVDTHGNLLNGVSFPGLPALTDWIYNFDSLPFARAETTQPPPTLLGGSASRSIFYGAVGDDMDLSSIGLVPDGRLGGWRMVAGARNAFGLRYRSLQVVIPAAPPELATILNVEPGGTLPPFGTLWAGNGAYVFTDTEPPVLGTAGFFFGDPNARKCPGGPTWTSQDETNEFVVGFGQRVTVAAWAKKSILNGRPDRFGYLGLYFDKAYKVDREGKRTQEETGILSEYGDFFPTEPGPIALMTKPDLTGGPSGQCLVVVLKLELDVNHDGRMDGRFYGPDNTTRDRPFVFWVNNDYDRYHSLGGSVLGEREDVQDDLDPAREKFEQPVPDHAYIGLALTGTPAVLGIPGTRDLEDYARLWTTGAAALAPKLGPDGVIELAWRNPSADTPELHLFRALELEGGTSYLTNEAVAVKQLDPRAFAGIISADQTLQISAAGVQLRTEKWIFCAASRGSGELVLRVRIGSTLVAETSAFIQTKDIKEMYERWTVGESHNVQPLATARLAGTGLPPKVPPFSYPYSHDRDTNSPYILFVHGWNYTPYERDSAAETSFKRLYWRGYEGRFGLFRWPAYWNFPFHGTDGGGYDVNSFDKSEMQAWDSAQPLRRLLTTLNTLYPDQVRVFAHSQGNIVVGEALHRAARPLVCVYTAMQAAVASHAYDPTATTRVIPTLLDDFTPNWHATYWLPGSPSYFSTMPGAKALANYFNPLDIALKAWETDQNLKPTDSLGYNYHPFRGIFTDGGLPLSLPRDTYAIFAFGVESRCHALGVEPAMGGVFNPTLELNLNKAFGFGSLSSDHSGQFVSNNMRRGPFWEHLMYTFQLRGAQ